MGEWLGAYTYVPHCSVQPLLLYSPLVISLPSPPPPLTYRPPLLFVQDDEDDADEEEEEDEEEDLSAFRVKVCTYVHSLDRGVVLAPHAGPFMMRNRS